MRAFSLRINFLTDFAIFFDILQLNINWNKNQRFFAKQKALLFLQIAKIQRAIDSDFQSDIVAESQESRESTW